MKVKCISNDNVIEQLTKDKIYEAKETNHYYYIDIYNDNEVWATYYVNRFIEIKEDEQVAVAPPQPKRPPHYESLILDPFTVAAMWNLPPGLTHALKYLVRDKAGATDDLDKAIRCIQMHKEALARHARVKAGEDPNVVWSTKL